MGRLHERLLEQNTSVLVIGGGDIAAAAEVAERYKLPFPVLADHNRSVYRDYGFNKQLWIIQQSGTVLVDRDGVIRYLKQATNPYEALDKQELQEAVAALQE